MLLHTILTEDEKYRQNTVMKFFITDDRSRSFYVMKFCFNVVNYLESQYNLAGVNTLVNPHNIDNNSQLLAVVVHIHFFVLVRICIHSLTANISVVPIKYKIPAHNVKLETYTINI